MATSPGGSADRTTGSSCTHGAISSTPTSTCATSSRYSMTLQPCFALLWRRRHAYTSSSIGRHWAGKSRHVVVALTTTVGRAATLQTVTSAACAIASRYRARGHGEFGVGEAGPDCVIEVEPVAVPGRNDGVRSDPRVVARPDIGVRNAGERGTRF